MDQTRLEAAEAAYAAGDWTAAAREYLAATAGEIQGSGYAFHRAGNALMKLKRLDDACAVYERSLQDRDYGDVAAVACNLGTARAALGTSEAAAAAYERALEDASYAGRYKALQGAAGAYYEMGRIEDAAEAYRQAALAVDNPDPGKALNNLGLCFMALDRPEDAVEAYRAAVDLPGYAGRGRASANLGMAFAALGMHERAVDAFERARDAFGHAFSPAMQAAYEAARSALRADERVEGWTTGEMPPVTAPVTRAVSFTDDDDEETARFFAMTDEEMKVADRAARRRERQERPHRPAWVAVLMWAAVAVLVAGAVVGAYLMGLGYPTQQMTVNGLLQAYADGDDVAGYWVAVPATDVEKAMSSVPASWTGYEMGPAERSARTSRVNVTVTLERGGVVTYEISLAREGVGWKVNGITTSFNSMDGGV